MIFFFKVIFGKLSLGLRILLATLIPTIIVMLVAPYLIDQYSPLLSDNMAKNVAIIRETLFYFFAVSSVIVLGLSGYLFWWLRKYRLHVDSVFKHIEEMTGQEIKGSQYQIKLERILNSFYIDFHKMQQKETLRQNFLIEKIDSLLLMKKNLVTQLKDIEKIVRTSTHLFDNLEKKIQANTQENLLYLSGNRFNQLNENIFKIQLNVLNISVETFKDFMGTDEKIPPITKEVESLIKESGEIIEELYRMLEENEDNKTRGKKELIEALVETGRHFAQISFLFGKFTLGLDKLEKLIIEFRKELSEPVEAEVRTLRESEQKSLQGIVQDVVTKNNGLIDSLNRMLYPEAELFRMQAELEQKQKEESRQSDLNKIEEMRSENLKKEAEIEALQLTKNKVEEKTSDNFANVNEMVTAPLMFQEKRNTQEEVEKIEDELPYHQQLKENPSLSADEVRSFFRDNAIDKIGEISNLKKEIGLNITPSEEDVEKKVEEPKELMAEDEEVIDELLEEVEEKEEEEIEDELEEEGEELEEEEEEEIEDELEEEDEELEEEEEEEIEDELEEEDEELEEEEEEEEIEDELEEEDEELEEEEEEEIEDELKEEPNGEIIIIEDEAEKQIPVEVYERVAKENQNSLKSLSPKDILKLL